MSKRGGGSAAAAAAVLQKDVPWRASPSGGKPIPKIHHSPVLRLTQTPHSNYALSIMKHPNPIGSGLGNEAIVEAAGPDCIVPGQITPVKLLGLKCFIPTVYVKVWPINVDLKFMEPVGRELKSIGKAFIALCNAFTTIPKGPIRKECIYREKSRCLYLKQQGDKQSNNGIKIGERGIQNYAANILPAYAKAILDNFFLYKKASPLEFLATIVGYSVAMEDEKLRKGPWYEEEDERLTAIVAVMGERRWDSVATVSGLRRSGKSCRMRWMNYLRPNLKHGRLSAEEERIILQLHKQWGNKWSKIARRLPGRTDNEIKNYWRSHLRKNAQVREQGNYDQSITNNAKQDVLVPKFDNGDCTSVKENILRTTDDHSDVFELSNYGIASSPYEVRISDWMSSWSGEQSEVNRHHGECQSLDSDVVETYEHRKDDKAIRTEKRMGLEQVGNNMSLPEMSLEFSSSPPDSKTVPSPPSSLLFPAVHLLSLLFLHINQFSNN
ncbi:unnamed protein product [Camellia sinensis]